MDGLTYTKASDMLGTGKTYTELEKKRINPMSTSDIEGSFGSTLKDAVGKVNELQKTADLKMQKLATGESSNLSEVMIAAEKADIAVKLMVSVRNKMIDAYQEIMKMQV